MISADEKLYLRNLACQVKDIADSDNGKEKRKLWADVAKLSGKRTAIMATVHDDLWLELLPPAKNLKITDPFFRHWEYELKKRLYRFEHLKDDLPVCDRITIPIDYKFSDWVENRKRPEVIVENLDSGLRTAEKYHPCLMEYSDIKLLKKPQLEYINRKKSDEQYEMASDVFGDILKVIKGEPYSASRDFHVVGWGLSMIDVLCELRGLEQLYYDLYDAPEFVHEAMTFLQAGTMEYLDTLEREHLLFLNNGGYMDNGVQEEASPIGLNGTAITDELPGADFDPGNVTAKNLWGYFMAQEFEPISPQQRDEFVLQYQKPLAQRFGMVSYGCCENNDLSYDYIFNAFPNLRAVSVPYSSNLNLAAARLKDYVMAWRPLSTLLENFDEKYAYKFADNAMSVMKDNNAITSLSGILTLHGKGEIFDRWVNICVERAKYYARG